MANTSGRCKLFCFKLLGAFSSQDPKFEDEVVNITVVHRDGTEQAIRGKIGDNLLYLCHRFASMFNLRGREIIARMQTLDRNGGRMRGVAGV